MTTNLFVTGSGTDIGKTWVCCLLLQALADRSGVRCVKPVVSGFETSDADNSDPGRLLAAQGLAIDKANIAATSPWRYRDPISADMAAAREQRPICFDELVEFSRAPAGTQFNIVEGVGGVMAPVGPRHTVLDWIEAIPARALLVSGSYLGSLSHTLTALSALQSRQIDVAAIVISRSAEEPVPIDETLASLGNFCGSTPILTIPRNEKTSAAGMAALVETIFP